MRCPWKIRKGKKLTGCYQTESAARRAAPAGWRPVFNRPPGVPLSGAASKLDLQLRRSKTNPCAVRVEIGGRVGRIGVRGKTTTVLIGLDDLDRAGLARDIVKANRASGGELPPGTRRTVERAVITMLKKASC